ncbi:MAG: hypothetical protein HUJ69_05985 [Lachnospiraceae bacterium]|nr:hypothetical protein [Lachnospiraceae bacterium]
MAKVLTEENIHHKLEVTAERLYRSGLAKAEAGDLTQAALDLEKAVRYDKYHKNARNFLGLVRFRTGELGEALKQWSISTHLHPEDNRAVDYLEDLKQQLDLLRDMGEAITLYNEGLELALKDEPDFALLRLKKAVNLSPDFIKAQLLLCVLYLQTEAYSSARMVLDHIAKVDPLNPEAMKYRLHLAALQKEGNEDQSVNIRDLSNDIFVQSALPEPRMKEFSSRRASRKVAGSARGFGMQLLLILVGIILGIELMALLYVPGKLAQAKETGRQYELTISELLEQNAALRGETEDSEGAEGTEGAVVGEEAESAEGSEGAAKDSGKE